MDKKAIMLVSTGTSQMDALESTSFQLLAEMKQQLEGLQYYMAFSSAHILEKINQSGEVTYFDVEFTFEQMIKDEIKEVYIQPTFLLKGLEYDKLNELKEIYVDRFDKITIGLPLLAEKEDYIDTLHAILKQASLEEDEALVLIGHGTTHSANVTYQNLEYTAYTQGHRNVFVGIVANEKSQSMLLRKLNASGYKKVCMMPVLFVAGYHAKKDISADSGSWRSILTDAGYEVRLAMRGLGELENIREIFIRHLKISIDLTE